jgi:UDP-N-acetylmuramoyl-tripeptide--D-alanyl-D-alanine ligase
MIAGLKFLEELKNQQKNSRAVAIIGDMLELGKNEVVEHEKIARYINDYNIDKVILVGNLTKNMVRLLPKNKLISSYETSKLLSKDISKLVKNNDILLIKGSNSMKMDLVVKTLTTVVL